MWRHLRNRQMGGAKFRRQEALGPFVLDFYCHEHSLVIEIDGGQHFEEEHARQDEARTTWIESCGLAVLRFTNREVLTEIASVLERILLEIECPEPSP